MPLLRSFQGLTPHFNYHNATATWLLSQKKARRADIVVAVIGGECSKWRIHDIRKLPFDHILTF